LNGGNLIESPFDPFYFQVITLDIIIRVFRL
jgi:hypothetical protein